MDKDKKKIMVVEDERFVAKHIRNQLQKAGYEVVDLISSGEEAVERAEALNPDLILMDIRLAGEIDGIEAAGKIRLFLNVPIVYLTAFADSETVRRSRTTEPFGYLLKPFEPKLLLSTIEISLYKHSMEKKLKESEARFRTLAESSPVGIFRTDREGNCIYVNEKFCEISGLKQEEAMGSGWVNSLHPEDREEVVRDWRQFLNSGAEFSIEFRFRYPDGAVTWVHGRAAALKDEKEELSGYMGTISDITGRKELEEKLLTKKKLESLGILAGGIAHDFNNLLAVIMGNISLAKEDFNPNDNTFKMLKSAEKASEEAAHLAQKLITFSKGGWLVRRPITMEDSIRASLTQFKPPDKTTVEVTIDKDLPTIQGDESQLVQVFDNLLQNAATALETVKEGQVKVLAELRKLEHGNTLQLEPGDYIRVTIEDNGVGIPREHLSRVFDPYFTTKNMGPRRGMGLGLTICYSVVTKHEGGIKIDSQPGKGTVVKVYLPVTVKETEAVVEPSVPEEKTDKGRIMVVDDEQTVLEITRQMLERLEYRVDTYPEGKTALDAYNKMREKGEDIDLFFLDLINKKGLGGKEMHRQLIEIDPGARVVLISGYLNNADAVDLKKEGFIDVVIKPFRLDELEDLLDRLIVKQ